MSNMELWNKVEKTDPSHTKHVNQKGGFTAIDAHYQIKCATERFGPVGTGWGWEIADPIYPPNGTVVIKVSLWYEKRDQVVTQFGQKKLDQSNGADEDAFKKATTDGLTKCLSYLGFNADVFLGKFDDNKYVNDLKREKQQSQQSNKMPDPAKVTGRIIASLNEVCTRADMKIFEDNQNIKSAYDNLPPEFKAQVDGVYNRKMATLNGEDNPFEDAA